MDKYSYQRMTKIVPSNSCTRAKQQGVVLAISLIMLLLMTLIGVVGMQTTSLEEKMAGNMRDRNLAFQAAEAALLAGETYLVATSPLPAFNCTNGLYPALGTGCASPNVVSTTAPMPPVWENITWTTNSVAYVGTLSNLSANPRYIIEDMGCLAPPAVCPGTHNYRITARATGGSVDTVVILQSTYQI